MPCHKLSIIRERKRGQRKVHDACIVAAVVGNKGTSQANVASNSEKIKLVALSIVVSCRHYWSVGRSVGQSVSQLVDQSIGRSVSTKL